MDAATACAASRRAAAALSRLLDAAHPGAPLDATAFAHAGMAWPQDLATPRWPAGPCIAPPADVGALPRAGAAEDDAAPPLELRLVRLGARPLALWHGPEAGVGHWAAWARARGLVAWPSAHEFMPLPEADRAGYANLARQWRPAVAGSGAWRGLLVGPAAPQVALAWLALQCGWDELLGRLLGYPPCCASAFARRWPIAQRQYGGDPACMLMAEGGHAAQLPWRLNVHARVLGPTLIDWFPCRADCPASLQLAQRIEAALALGTPQLLPAIAHRMRSRVAHRPGRPMRIEPVDVAGRPSGPPLSPADADDTPPGPGGWDATYCAGPACATEFFP